jgi:hypothetical protein
MERRDPFCADVSLENAEPLAATASRVDHWILVEYRGLWGYDALAASTLREGVRRHLAERAAALGHTKVLFVRRPERRRHEQTIVFWGSSSERGSSLSCAHLERWEDLLELDFETGGRPLRHPLLLVCTHGKHDPCCARLGRPLYTALADQLEDEWVWQCSHVGGDRFAGNLVCLPEGLYFGRVTPADAWRVLDEYLAGRIDLEHYRGRSCYAPGAQAGEIAVRRSTGLRGVDDVELVSRRPLRFSARGRLVAVDVAPVPGPLSCLTCSAETLRQPRRFAARILRESAA